MSIIINFIQIYFNSIVKKIDVKHNKYLLMQSSTVFQIQIKGVIGGSNLLLSHLVVCCLSAKMFKKLSV